MIIFERLKTQAINNIKQATLKAGFIKTDFFVTISLL